MTIGFARSRRHRISVTLICALISLLMAGGPIAIMAHYVLVPHVLCEHGELVEVTGRIRASVRGMPGRPVASPDRGDPFGLHHDHCTMAATGRVVAALYGHVNACIGRVSAPRARIQAARPVGGDGLAVLHLAPKTSPPLA